MSSSRLVLDAPLTETADEVYRGRLIGQLLTPEDEIAVCVRVPRNGLWCWRPDLAPEDSPDGCDDRWVLVASHTAEPLCRPAERARLGAWVEVRPLQGFFMQGYFELKELPPRRVRLEWQPVSMEPHPLDRPRTAGWTYHPVFPDDPDLEAWARGKFGRHERGGAELTAQRGWTVGWSCSCGELGCGSILLEVQPSAEEGWVELRELSCGHCDGWDLMPWLLVRRDAPVRPCPAAGGG